MRVGLFINTQFPEGVNLAVTWRAIGSVSTCSKMD